MSLKTIKHTMSQIGGLGVPNVSVIQAFRGRSAYEVAVANGFVGNISEWFATFVGPAISEPEYYGAAGDGIRDDTVELNQAAAAALAIGGVLIAKKKYKTTGPLYIECHCEMSAATINYYGTGAALEISSGAGSNNISSKTQFLPKVVNKTTLGASSRIGRGVGVKILNVINSEIHVGEVRDFEIGIWVAGLSKGCSYNNIHVGYCANNHINLLVRKGDVDGWVNENLFIGGRYLQADTMGSEVGSRHILSEGNNCLFLKPSVEGDNPEYHIEIANIYNRVIQGRYETTGGARVLLNGSTTTVNACVFDGGYQLALVNFTTLGTVQGVTVRTDDNLGSRRQYRRSEVGQHFSSNSLPLRNFFDFSKNLPELPAANFDSEVDWMLRESANAYRLKRSTDTAERCYLDGLFGRFYTGDGTAAPTKYIGSHSSGIHVAGTPAFSPTPDNAITLGTASFRWSVVYAGTGTINTSDERDKQQIQPLDEKEKLIAHALKRMVRKFKFNDAVILKGDGARWHFGFIAQEVQELFAEYGLNAFDYGVLCYDEWEAEPAEFDAEGNMIHEGHPAGNRYGVRENEIYALILSAL